MFGVYTNQRLSENERKLLHLNPDDLNWYCVILKSVFRDERFFQIREDIDLPQDEDDDGVVLIFEGGEVVYFKTIIGEITEEKVQSIFKVCKYLEDKFNRPITAYIPCSPFTEVDVSLEDENYHVTMIFGYIPSDDAEEIIDRLQNKLKSKEIFTVGDSIDHMILPFWGYKDKEVFDEKYARYMEMIETYEFD